MKKERLNFKLNWGMVSRWFIDSAYGWRDYILAMPHKARLLTRYDFRIRLARLLFAIVLTYLIAGVGLGLGFYIPSKWCTVGIKKIKICPLRVDNSFSRFWTQLYPYPVKIVGWQVVTLKDVSDQEKVIDYFASHSGNALPDRFEVDKKVVSSIEEIELSKKALHKYNLKVTNKDVDDIIKKIEDENGGKDKVKELLQSLYGLNVDGFRGIVREQLYKDKVRSDVLKNIRVRHILVADEAKAKDIKGKIERNEISFEDAAKQNSTDQSTKDTGGLITVSADSEYINRDAGLVKEFNDVAFSLERGKISDPVKTEFGWHIIKVDDAKGKENMTFDEYIASLRKKVLILNLWKR